MLMKHDLHDLELSIPVVSISFLAQAMMIKA